MAKSPDAYRTISEAASEVGVPQHVLRFWETRFAFLKPMKRAGGRRLYRPEDVAVLQRLRGLLHDQGYTIRGVQQLHRAGGLKDIVTPPPTLASADRLQRALEHLDEARTALEALRAPDG